MNEDIERLNVQVRALWHQLESLKNKLEEDKQRDREYTRWLEATDSALDARIKHLEDLAVTESLSDKERRAAYAKCLREIILSVIGFAELKEDCHNEVVKGVERMLKGGLGDDE